VATFSRVIAASPVEQREEMVIEFKDVAPQFPRELGSPRTVVGIGGLGQPAGIVQQRKQRHHFDIGTRFGRQSPAVFQHAGPMRNSMTTVYRQRVIVEDCMKNGFQIHAIIVVFWPLPSSLAKASTRLEGRWLPGCPARHFREVTCDRI
jgi:hypothetical protein